MLNLAEKVKNAHKPKQRKYDCVNYNCTSNTDMQCGIIIDRKIYYSECELSFGKYCPYFNKKARFEDVNNENTQS